MDHSQIIEKIKKCLALGRSSNVNEAASALRHAQAMMEKYNISMDEVAMSDISGQKTQEAQGANNPPRHIGFLIDKVRALFRCSTVSLPGWDGRNYTFAVDFIGRTPNPEIAAYTFDVLRRRLVAGRKAYMASLPKRLKRATKTKRADLWSEMWVLAAFKNLPKPPLTEEEDRLITAYMDQKYPALVDSKPRKKHNVSIHDVQAMMDGSEAGSQVYVRHGVNSKGEQDLIGG
ncbi:DUF2786 domain-containing protein [Desulfatibacillum aliphaticivorans]|uniref:DUF2786 domain-containing protein n=1 Tax=Desulfatibacillum aliphaticivorans TaxID=218208 RepID=UPI0004154AAE|nr:DUF2786 domain-containing protein [Desulfatibacillum aliphaticivorans]